MDPPAPKLSENAAPESPPPQNNAAVADQTNIVVEDKDDRDDNDRRGLLSNKRKRIAFLSPNDRRRKDWLRPYWLGAGLFLTLFSFWLLDSLKDPVFALLVDGNLDKHQPPAKLCSVASTLALVCFLEFISHARKQHQREQQERHSDQDILDPGGRWTSMSMERGQEADGDRVPISIFAYVGASYICVFSLLAYLLTLHPSENISTESTSNESSSTTPWHVMGYILYATIESFGSISVATFWSYTNSTLSLRDAEDFYGLIIALAQLGAIGGSSMVTTHYWSTTTLILVANLVIILQVTAMMSYSKRFRPTANIDAEETSPEVQEQMSEQPVFWSGIYLILRYRYVMLILGVSCLYEVSLTCLDYQMKLLGWFRFEGESQEESMSFTQFMGHYGQVTNIASLLFSYFVFPYLIHKFGLRITLRLFPTLLFLATVLAFGAVPGNLAVLFVSMTILKAMTYSIHDPSKELLYLPTSLAIKFRSKFWIDVVGARVAKAVGSTINTFAGNVDQSIRVGTVPSLLTAAALWFVCYRAGIQFDRLVREGKVVGHNATGSSPMKASKYSVVDSADDVEDVHTGLIGGEEDEEDSADLELKPLR